MRKLIVELRPTLSMPDAPAELQEKLREWKRVFERIESVSLLEILKVDFERGLKLILCEVIVADGYSIGDITIPGVMEILHVIRVQGRAHTCLIRGQAHDEFFRRKMQAFDLDLIWTTPITKSPDRIVYSCIGDEANLQKFLRLMEAYGEVLNVSFQPVTYDGRDILGLLTEQQRRVLLAAKRSGYYDYPRKTSGGGLAEELGVSKATAIEHLRRAESRIMAILLAGH
ncbi:helix-turn-helix domain-containing protein [Methanoculleus taiwanensis]|uniref:helix-turn-helix domain-containing protein n=1 Tax=Methanoculleus taiwanensis TaxID=1550565 RepID=UPI000FFF2EE5|nr:helix-turn-helix domain-containing protein [Methanoculleus taiwanensis]